LKKIIVELVDDCDEDDARNLANEISIAEEVADVYLVDEDDEDSPEDKAFEREINNND
jgi:hypothetical protein